MLDTGSVFDVLASDDSDRRVAQRKALALSQARLDNSLGRFLTGAVTTDEFRARMAAVQDDFARHVAQTSAEVGYDQPERLIPVLTAHYERNRKWQPVHSFGTPEVHYDGPAYPNAGAQATCPTCGGPVDPATGMCATCAGAQGAPGPAGGQYYAAKDPHWIEHGDKHPGALHRELGVPEGEKIPEDKLEGALHSDNKLERERAQYAENVKKVRSQDIGKSVDPSEMQDSNDGKGVNEPHQDDEDAKAPKIKASGVGVAPMPQAAPQARPGAEVCPECGTPDCPHSRDARGTQFLNTLSMPEHLRLPQASRTADSGNTDLGGPEPTMDKRLWEPSNLGDPDVADGRWPTERIDMTEPVGPPNNEHELSSIGERFTEHQSLPSETENSGFQSGGPGPAPHTDTFGNDGQATPVTRETQPE